RADFHARDPTQRASCRRKRRWSDASYRARSESRRAAPSSKANAIVAILMLRAEFLPWSSHRKKRTAHRSAPSCRPRKLRRSLASGAQGTPFCKRPVRDEVQESRTGRKGIEAL